MRVQDSFVPERPFWSPTPSLRSERVSSSHQSEWCTLIFLPGKTILFSNVLKLFWLWQKALTPSFTIRSYLPHKGVFNHFKLHKADPHSQLWALDHPWKITVPDTGPVLVELFSRRIPSLSWQSAQLCQHICYAHCVSVVQDNSSSFQWKMPPKQEVTLEMEGSTWGGWQVCRGCVFTWKELSKKARHVVKKGPEGCWIICMHTTESGGELLGNNGSTRRSSLQKNPSK